MRRFLRKHAETVVVAFVVAAVTAGAPAIAAVVQNAFHAHIADIAKNARRLGGTSPGGFYKTTDIVAEATHAANADELGGQPATAYALAANAAARAYVLVDNNGGTGGIPSVVQSNPSGWGVAKAPAGAGDGVYCLTPPSGSGLDPTKESGVATVEFSLSDDKVLSIFAEVDSKPTAAATGSPPGAGCASGQFAVRTFKGTYTQPNPCSACDVQGTPDKNVAFTFYVT